MSLFDLFRNREWSHPGALVPSLDKDADYRLVLPKETGFACSHCAADMGSQEGDYLDGAVVRIVGTASGRPMECPECEQYTTVPSGWYIIDLKVDDGNNLPVAVNGEWLEKVTVVDAESFIEPELPALPPPSKIIDVKGEVL